MGQQMGSVMVIQFAPGVKSPNVLYSDETVFTRIIPM
jgi:hypothetical protein